MLIYASSCQKYFAAHGEAFIASAEKCGHTVKIDMVDDFPEWRKQSLIAQLNADRIIYSAHSLREVIEKNREDYPEITDKITYVGNACDYDYWNIPMKDAGSVRAPFKIMYIGAFSAWLDFPMIIEVIQKCTIPVRFYFVGANFTGRAAQGYLEYLKGMGDKVVILPHWDYNDLTFLAKSADLFWIPFDVTERKITDMLSKSYFVKQITQNTNPIKFWEYLATGRPIIHTAMRALLEYEKDWNMEELNIYCASKCNDGSESVAEDVIEGIKQFTSPEGIRRTYRKADNNRAIAREHTWAHKARQVDEVIHEALNCDIEAERLAKAEIARTKPVKGDENRFINLHDPTPLVDLLAEEA